jgi:hypothetical protein
VSLGHEIVPHPASSCRFSQALPDGAQRRQLPPQAAVQHTLPPLEVGWQLPAPPRQPSCARLQPSAPHSKTVRHCPPVQRWKFEPEHCAALFSQTGASTHTPVALQISLAWQTSPQHTLSPLPVATQAPLSHSEPEPQGVSSAFFGRLQLP